MRVDMPHELQLPQAKELARSWTMKSLKAYLLIASRQLMDPNFRKSVVLLIQHTDEGALGVVLNRPTSKTVDEVWKELGDSPCLSHQPVCLGGPVAGPLIALHTNQFFAELEVLPGLFFAASKKNLDDLVLHDDDPLRVFIGHAGWGPGQLENEIEAGAWLLAPATSEDIFYDGTDLWEQVTQRAGRLTLVSMLGIKHVPDDPSMN